MLNTKAIIGTTGAAMLAMTLMMTGCAKPADTNATKTETTASSSTEKKDTATTQDQKPVEKADDASTATASQAPAQQTPTTTTTADGYIGEEVAKKAALDRTGFTEADVTELKAELDADDATAHYDVDFKNGGLEYDVDVNASTGEIMTFSSEADD